MRFISLFLIVFCSSVSAVELKEVVTDGYGSDVSEAAQNAAQNALGQVVGTFVDVSNSLEKDVRVQDGVRLQSKSIRTDIKEYSQGYIKRFEIVDVKREQMVKVTARSLVGVDDLKSYVRELAQARVEMNEGLFARVKTEEKQSNNAAALLHDRVLDPLIRGEAIEFEVSAPVPISELLEASRAAYPLASRVEEMKRKNSGSSIIGFYVTSRLKRGFFEYAKKLLGEISRSAGSMVAGDPRAILQRSSAYDQYNHAADIVVVMQSEEMSGVAQKRFDWYHLSGVKSDFAKRSIWGEVVANGYTNKPGASVAYSSGNLSPNQNLQVEFIGSNGEVIQRELANGNPGSMFVSSVNSVDNALEYVGRPFYHPWSLALNSRLAIGNNGVMVRSASKYLVVVAVSQSALRDSRSILIKLI